MGVSIFLFLCACVNLYWGLSLYNGDVFFLPCFYRDMVEGHGHWFFWTFSQAKFFFPDMPLYWAFKQLFPDSYLAPLFAEMLVYGTILGIFSVWFFSTFFKMEWRTAILCASFNLALFTSPVFNLMGILQGVIWPAFHAGGFAITLISIIALFTALKKRKGYWILLPLGIVGGFSDPLYLLDFALPALGVVLLDKLPWAFKATSVMALILASLGVLAAQLFSPYLLPSFAFIKTTSLAAIFSKLGLCIYTTVAISISKPLALVILIFVAWTIWKNRAAMRSHWREAIIFGGGALLPFGAAIITGTYTGTAEWRYFPEVVLFGLMMAIGSTHKKRLVIWELLLTIMVLPPFCATVRFVCGDSSKVYVASVANIGHDPIVSSSLPSWRELERPSDMRVLEELKRRYHLHDGLAVDWLCRPTNALSRTGLRLHQITGKGSPWLLLNTVQEYGVLGISQTPGNHDFIVDYLFDANDLIRHFGRPSGVVTLKLFPRDDTLVNVLIYPPGVLDRVLSNDPAFSYLIFHRLQVNPYLLDKGAGEILSHRFRSQSLQDFLISK